MVANDALLEATNRSPTELQVPGYLGEPYLRIGPEGVCVNRNSPAAYLNDDRYAQRPVPEGVTEDAQPRWTRVADASSDGAVYRWHDHRIHWMAPTLPPQVKANGGVETVVLDWLVPFTLGEERLGVEGSCVGFRQTLGGLGWVAGLIVASAPMALAA